ncbi:hypothetical protein GCM10011321_24330 [Youhaiella tibetensis]|nr:hypothetical protein XM25_01030 [Devosia sp. H5989]GGF32245.1 hypothetical protein GCM10011321_24330 [Youhaiella tibetensis]
MSAELAKPVAGGLSAPMSARFLFIANGNGEDSIAAEIISRLPEGVSADAYPVVGAGGAYEGIAPIVGPRFEIPSQGWRHTKGSVARDVRGGMLSSIGPALSFLRSARGRYDKVVVVGDNVGPILCLLAGLKIDIYLDVFKSGFAHTYSAPERWLIRRTTRTVFTRDAMLAETLARAGIDARAAGNVMLDTTTYGQYDAAARRRRPLAVTLLPGSRATTGESLALQVEALRLLPEAERPDAFVAVAGGIAPDELATATGLRWERPNSGEAADLGRLVGEDLLLNLATGVTGNLIEAADVVLSQAGTATQQALGLGRPVITFDRADNRRKRMADEQALMGEARRLVPQDAHALAQATARLLADRDERARLGEIGAERLGPFGAAARIVERLLE